MVNISPSAIKDIAVQLPEHNILTPFVRAILVGYEGLMAKVEQLESTVSVVKDSQDKRLNDLEAQQETTTENIGILFSLVSATKGEVAELKEPKIGPGTEEQQEKIETYLMKSPKKRAAYGELRDHLGVTKSRFSQIIRNAGFIILQNVHDKRRRLLQLPANF